MSTSFWLDRSLGGETQTFDAVIVGGGVSGLSTAYWLHQEDPGLKIALVEKSRIGFGASGRNAGFITCGSVEHFNRLIHKHGREKAASIWKFSEENLRLLKEHIVQDEAERLHFETRGSFSLASTEPEVQELKKTAQLMGEHGIRVEEVPERELRSRLGVSDFLHGIRYIDDASVHPVRLLEAIRKKTPITYLEQTEVFGIESCEDGTRRIRTDRSTLEAPMVILALDGYSALLNTFFRDKIFPTRGQILITEPTQRVMEGPCYANFYLDYFRQLPGGEMLVGGFRQLEKETEVGFSDHTTETIQNALEQFIEKHLPFARGLRISHRWSGVMGFSADGEPLVGMLPNDTQIAYIGGFTGHGLGLAFNAAKCLVGSIFGREIPEFISGRRFT